MQRGEGGGTYDVGIRGYSDLRHSSWVVVNGLFGVVLEE
jgi:hypothetical protein